MAELGTETRVACLVCGGPTVPWLSTPIDCKKDTPTGYGTIVRCPSCEMGSIHPVPRVDEIADFYQLAQYYTQGESHIKDRAATFVEKLLLKLAYKADRGQMFDPDTIAATLPANASICDLGCGDAHYLQRFKTLGFSVLGVDPDEAAIARAADAGVTVLPGTADWLPDAIAGQSFDLVIMTHSLEHCRDPLASMKNAFRLTKPGGLCYIEVPNCASEHFKRFTICSEMFDAPRHIHFFTPRALRSLAEGVGFSVKERRFVYYLRNFLPGWRDWEHEVARRVRRVSPDAQVVAHSLTQSILLFLTSFWRPAERKYDSVGLLMERPA
jgi:SAM-dependent methyltransferase